MQSCETVALIRAKDVSYRSLRTIDARPVCANVSPPIRRGTPIVIGGGGMDCGNGEFEINGMDKITNPD